MWRRVFEWVVREVAMDRSALTAVTEGTVVPGHVMKHSPNDTASPKAPTVWLWRNVT